MGGQSSTERRVTIEEDDNVGMVKVSESVARRLLGQPEPDFKADPVTQKRSVSDDEIKKLESYYQHKIELLEKDNALLFEETKEQFKKAVEEVEQKFLKTTASPICQELQDEVLKCYQANPNRTLNCSPVVQAFNNCVQKQREKILTKG